MSEQQLKIEISTNLQDAYDEQYTDQLSTWRELGGKYKAQNIVEVCQSIGKIDKLLDVGAGEGSLLKYFDAWNFGENLYALEISRSGIDYIKKRELSRLVDVRQFDGYRIPYEDNFFDLTVLSHVLEHVEYPRLLLRELCRVSKYQVIEIPCDFSFQADKKVKFFLSYGHIDIYTPVLLRFLLLSEGMEIVQDKLSQTATEVQFYGKYVNQKSRKTWRSQLKFRYHLWKRAIPFRYGSQVQRELAADAYTILCQKGHSDLKIMS